MPVITRNQRLNNVASMEKPQKPINQQVIVKVKPDMNDLLPWFTSVAKEALQSIEKSNMEKATIRKLLNFHPNNSKHSKSALERKFRTIHFDIIRRATELMYFVDQYLPEIYNKCLSMQRFAEVVYKKVQQLYDEIRNIDVKPETDDERSAVVAMIYVLQDVEKNIIPLLSADVQLKRRRNFVDYTGMDTIEPLDGITDIWFDLTLAVDPDYEPMEDEEDDDLDRYVVYDEEDEFEGEEPEEDEHDYSEDEDYIPDEEDEEDIYEEDEIFEISVKSKKFGKEPRKVFKSSNHILFEYEE